MPGARGISGVRRGAAPVRGGSSVRDPLGKQHRHGTPVVTRTVAVSITSVARSRRCRSICACVSARRIREQIRRNLLRLERHFSDTGTASCRLGSEARSSSAEAEKSARNSRVCGRSDSARRVDLAPSPRAFPVESVGPVPLVDIGGSHSRKERSSPSATSVRAPFPTLDFNDKRRTANRRCRSRCWSRACCWRRIPSRKPRARRWKRASRASRSGPIASPRSSS